MSEKTKDFDAVKMMREAWDRISRDIKDMSFEEQKAYFRKHALETRNELKPSENTEAVQRG
jgi:hypothetical protein